MREKEELTLDYRSDLKRQLGDGGTCLCGETCCKDGKPAVTDAAKPTKAPASAGKPKPSATKPKPIQPQPRVAAEPVEDVIGPVQGPLLRGQMTPLVEMQAPPRTRSGMHDFYSWQFGPPQAAV